MVRGKSRVDTTAYSRATQLLDFCLVAKQKEQVSYEEAAVQEKSEQNTNASLHNSIILFSF